MKSLNKKIAIYSGLLLVGLSAAGAAMFWLVLSGDFYYQGKENIDKKNVNYYHQAQPNDLNFYQDVYSFPKKKIDFQGKEIVAGIAPHHLLAGDLLAEFYSNLEGQNFSTIILLSPNHYQAGRADIISSQYNWQTPFGVLAADKKLLSQLIKNNKKIAIEENIFKQEHGISAHVAFIKKTFPQAAFLPLVLSPRISQTEAELLARLIYKLSQNKNILLLASVDFSHYKDSQTAQKNDQVSIEALNNFNLNAVYSLDLDSPAAIYIVMEYSKLKNGEFYLLNNSNSAILSGRPEIKNTTSYVTGYFLNNKLTESFPENKNKVKMIFFGDLMLDRYVKEKIEKHGFDYLLKNLAGEENRFFQGVDLISCNLEGTVTNNGAHYPPIMSYDFAFAPSVVAQLKKYRFNYFNLANNHFADQGERGIIETRQNLDKLGFDYVGCRDGQVGECSHKAMEISGQKVGLAGFSMVYRQFDLEKAASVVKNLASATDLVIVQIHWGKEYEHQFSPEQQKTAHALIDAGADVIIGHHPHVIQGIEIYKNKPIFYSLGNFIFDQYFSPDTQEELAVGIVKNSRQVDFFLYPIISKASQLTLMVGKEKEKVFQKIVSWSQLNDKVREQVKDGHFSLFYVLGEF